MTHITIETALLEQLVGALEVSKRWHNGDKYRYGKPQQRQAWTAQSGELDTAITAGRAAIDGAERVPTHRPTGWMAHRDQYAVQVLFNPYTGEPRDVRDVQSDPQGILIMPPGKVEMLAAKKNLEPKLWLWKNFVDGRQEYWAFDNLYPINMNDDDPQTLGEPCGYALLKPSRNGRKEQP